MESNIRNQLFADDVKQVECGKYGNSLKNEYVKNKRHM